MNTDIQTAAVEYVAHGWRLVPLGADKRPVRAKWNERARVVDTVEAAASLRSAGIGLAHAYSGTCCIDIDDPEAAAAWLDERGIDLGALRAAPDAVVIESPKAGRFKLLYRLPAGRDAPRTFVPVKGLELRCAAANGKTVQDVLPPSPHPAGGVYRWASGSWRDLPELPLEVWLEWRPAGDTAPDAPDVPDDYPAPLGLTRVEAVKVLSKIDPDVSYPEWVKVGQALQHEFGDEGLALWMGWSSEGSKYPGPELLSEKWDGFGHAAKPVTMRSIIRDYASAAEPDEFEVIEDPRVEVQAGLFMTPAAIVQLPPPCWIIRGTLPKAGLGVIYGPPGSGKSFVALDMAFSVARGRAWNEQRTKPGRIVYVAAEGFGGMVSRVKAYMVTHSLEDVADFLMYPRSVALTGDEWKPFAKNIVELGGADVIVFDTLARCMAGADENSSEGMGAVIRSCEKLHEATGALILLVHHSGKDVERGARGWSGLRGAVDVEMTVERQDDAGDLRRVSVTKQKDGDDSGEFFFKLVPVDIGLDSDGEPVPAKVLEYVDAPVSASPRYRDLPPDESLAAELIGELAELADGWATYGAVSAEWMRKTPTSPGETQAKRDTIFKRALTKLRERGIIEVDGQKVRLT